MTRFAPARTVGQIRHQLVGWIRRELSLSVGSAARERVAARLARSLRWSSEVLPGAAV
jgi:hypothetical protein